MGALLAPSYSLSGMQKQGYEFWNISDHLAMTVSLGIGFGRIANFINGELWGRVSSAKWAIIFPQEVGLRYGEYDTNVIEQLVTSGHLFLGIHRNFIKPSAKVFCVWTPIAASQNTVG